MTMRILCTTFVVVALITCGHAARVGASGSLFESIRRDDLAAVAATATSPALNAPDDSGTTPLMHAVLYARPAVVTLLLDRGAAVNTANSFGSTALMWAGPRTEIVRLLLARGADGNARASDGATARVVVGRVGNVEAMQAMVAAGADMKSPAARTGLLTAVYVLQR